MKKKNPNQLPKTIILFLAISFSFIFQNAKAQTHDVCNDALTITAMQPGDSDTATFEASSREYWFSFVATDDSITFNADTNIYNNAHLHEIFLYSGACSALNTINSTNGLQLTGSGLTQEQIYYILVKRSDPISCDKAGCQFGEKSFTYSFLMETESCLEAIISGAADPIYDFTTFIASFQSPGGQQPAIYDIGNDFEMWECQNLCFDDCGPTSSPTIFTIYDITISGPGGFFANNSTLAANGFCLSGLVDGSYSMNITSTNQNVGTINFIVHPDDPTVDLILNSNPVCDGTTLANNLTIVNEEDFTEINFYLDGILVDLNFIPSNLLCDGLHELCVEAFHPCSFTPETDCITFSIQPEVVFTTDVNCNSVDLSNTSICPNLLTNWLWDFGDGTTSISMNPVSHLYPNAGTYTITLTGTSSCTGIVYQFSQTVTTFTPPTPVISGNPDMCNLSLNIYTLSGIIPGSITWEVTPTAGFIISAPNAITATVSWFPNITVPASVVAYGTDINGCDFSVSFNVNPCCAPVNSLPPGSLSTITSGPSNLSTYFVPWSLAVVQTSPVILEKQSVNIYIYEDLIIDVNVQFAVNCTLYVAPGKKIYVQPGKSFQISDGVVTNMCPEMWDAIIGDDDNTNIILRNSIINQALNGITSENGADISSIGSFYIDNHKSMVIKNCTGSQIMDLKLERNRFKNNMNQLTPYSGQQAHKGIEILNVNNVQVGSTGNNTTNYFKWLDYGIHVTNSNVTVYNNDFTRIQQVAGSLSCPTCKCPAGTAICATRSLITAGSRTINVGDQNVGNTFRKNNFTYSKYGVKVIGNYNSNIKYNETNRVTFGVEISDSKSKNIVVRNNIFKNFSIGTGIYNMPGSIMDISQNDYNLGIGAPPFVNNTAIYINHTFSSAFTATIDNNNIDRVRNGIYLINANGLVFTGSPVINITNNTINFSQLANNNYGGNTHYGVRLEGSTLINVSHNFVSKAGAFPNAGSVGFLKGIGINNSPISVIYENELTKMPEGIWAFGNCSGSGFVCNDLISNYNGFNFQGPADIGNQLGTAPNEIPTGNKWFTPVIPNGDLTGSIAQINSNSIHWWYRIAPNEVPSSGVTAASLAGGGNQDQPELTSNSVLCGLLPLFSPPEEERERRMGPIVRNEKFIPVFTEEFSLYDHQFAYKQLMMNNNWLSLGTADDTTYQNYFIQKSGTSIGLFESVNNFWNNDDLASAIAVNNSINTNTDWEYYRKRTNELVLNELFTDSITTSQDSLEHTEIAYLNSLNIGPAAFTSRAKLRLDITDLPNGETRFMINEETNKIIETTLFSVYPNPSNGKISIILSESIQNHLQLEIIDVSGKVVCNYEIKNAKTKEALDLSLSPGIYFIKGVIDQNPIGEIKLIITK